ncbi:MAG: DMT family transporter, partial [Planctomycetes bacterium]|nr:DMT family transporter [Planctomycetota bacterium]
GPVTGGAVAISMSTAPLPPDPAERRLGLLMAMTTACLWGFLAIAMKVATEEVPVETIVWFRFAFAFGILALWIASRDLKRLRILGKPPFLLWVSALGLTGNYFGYLAGLDHTTPSNAQILIQAAPLMLALVGIFLFKERLVRAQWLGVALSLVGFVVFALDQRRGGVVSHDNYFWGNLLIFGGAVAWAIYAAAAKYLGGIGYKPQDLNLFIYALPAFTLWFLVDWGVLSGLSWKMWVVMCFLGANTLIAYGCLGEAFKRLPAYQVSLIITLNPLITLAAMAALRPLAPAWLPKDRVGTLGYSAALLVVGGVIQVLRKAPTARTGIPRRMFSWPKGPRA